MRIDFEMQSLEPWDNRNNLSAQLPFHSVLKPNLSRCSFLKILHKANVFRFVLRFSGGGRTNSTKACARVRHYMLLCMTKAIQKLGHHASNLCFVGGRNSEHGFFPHLSW